MIISSQMRRIINKHTDNVCTNTTFNSANNKFRNNTDKNNTERVLLNGFVILG